MTDLLEPFYKTTRVPIKLDHWSEHQDKLFRKCPLAWYRNAVLKLKPKVKKEYFSKGTAYHDALETFYTLPPEERSMKLMLDKFEESVRAAATEDTKIGNLVDSAVLVFDAYWKKWGADEKIPQAETEVSGEVEIPNTGGVKYVYRVDLLVREPQPFILDFKTGDKLDAEDLIAHDLQLPRYIWALVNSGLPVSTAIYQCIKTVSSGRGKIELARRPITPSRREISWAVHDLAMVVNEVQREDRLIYHNYGFGCRFCDYHDICLVAKSGGDPEAITQENYTQGGSESGDSNIIEGQDS